MCEKCEKMLDKCKIMLYNVETVLEMLYRKAWEF